MEEVARELNELRRASLESWSIGTTELAELVGSSHIRVITPGSSAGALLQVLRPLESPSSRWRNDVVIRRTILFEATVPPFRNIDHDLATTVGPFSEMQNGARATVGPFCFVHW